MIKGGLFILLFMVVEWTTAKSLVDAMESGIIHRNGVALAKKNDGFSPIQDRWRLLYRSPCGCDDSCSSSFDSCCTGCRLAPPPPPPPPPRCSSCNFAPKPPPPPPPPRCGSCNFAPKPPPPPPPPRCGSCNFAPKPPPPPPPPRCGSCNFAPKPPPPPPPSCCCGMCGK